MTIVSLLLAAQLVTPAQADPQPDQHDEIVVTASLHPVSEDQSPATVTIIRQELIEALDEPLTVDLLRLVPGVSVASAGPPGTQSQVRIRGAEANHTLLLIDGIRFNDPAAGNEPRFELLSNEGLRRVEVVRGPQSALYGSEAIGGVVALFTGRDRPGAGASAQVEGGSDDFLRASASATLGSDSRSVTAYGGYQRSDGIDVVGRGGDRDGYDNLTLGGSVRLNLTETLSLGASGRFADATSEFDGLDETTFRRADTSDESRSRLGAARLWAAFSPASGWSLSLGGTALASSNRNRRDDAPLNRTSGRRFTLDGLVSHEFTTGPIGHKLSLAANYEDERFEAGDQAFFGATDQVRSRQRAAVLGEWQTRIGDRLTSDVALRHDSFEGFADATTLRASALLALTGPLSFRLGYGEGIARPTFFDLFGFFPGSFSGNPELGPERSRGFEAGLLYNVPKFQAGVTAFGQRLTDEIVDVFDPVTFLSSTQNAAGESRRKGMEVEGRWSPTPHVSLGGSYTYLDAEEQQVRGESLLREVRRARHSGSIAADGRWGRISAGLSIAYVGKRRDLDFDLFPADRVTLDDYVLANVRAGYRLSALVELFARVSNLLDAEYQDVVGFATPGRSVSGGVRLRFGE